MAESLLAVLLVTSSAKGSGLVYRWPPQPSTRPRLARPRPHHDSTCFHADNPWRAACHKDIVNPCAEYEPEDDDYLWRRPHIIRDRSLSFSHSRSHPSSRRTSPSKDLKDVYAVDTTQDAPSHDEYDDLLGYSAEFLASLLSPQRAMCHQKFELVVDDLAFIGHPVCADADGVWRFAPERVNSTSRGRGSKKGQSPRPDETSLTPERVPPEKPPTSTWLQTFHLVLVFDLPDPTSSASGNVSKYFDIVYEQIVFPMTAVLYQEQILHNYVEAECESLGTLREEYNSKGESFSDYIDKALAASSFAPAMKTVYESIKDGVIARITLREFPLELQLPPYLDSLLHDDDSSDIEFGDRDDEDEFDYGSAVSWGPEMSFAWRLPTLTPWKSLLRLDEDGDYAYDLYMKLRGPQMNPEDRDLAEQLIRFLDLASITLCLADMASLLDWDLESQVYPIVRWLVHHRRAKVVDMVHPGLKTIFALPQKLPSLLSKLSAEFSDTFSHPAIPPLPKLLSLISTSKGPHFYGAIVGSKEMIPMYHDVVVWMLKRDLLVTMHLRVRVFATAELKERVRVKRELAMARRGRIRSRSHSVTRIAKQPEIIKGIATKPSESTTDASPQDHWFNMSPRSARRQTRKMSPPRDARPGAGPSGKDKDKEAEIEEEDDDTLFDDTIDVSSSSGIDETTSQKWDDALASMIPDPGRATPLERQWLAMMSELKDPYIARRFEQINQYFDGKCSDDEILYKADISRKQLREVLHHYEEYLQLFLHPS